MRNVLRALWERIEAVGAEKFFAIVFITVTATGVVWYYFDIPAVATLARKFFVETLPLWWRVFIIKFVPQLIAQALAKRSVQVVLIFIFFIFAEKEGRKKFEQLQKNAGKYIRVFIFIKPQRWWRVKSMFFRITLIGSILLSIVFLGGLHIVGAGLVFVDLIVRAAIWALRYVLIRLLPKIGAGKFVAFLYQKAIPFVWGKLPRFVRRHERIKEFEKRWILFMRWRVTRIISRNSRKVKKKIKNLTQ